MAARPVARRVRSSMPEPELPSWAATPTACALSRLCGAEPLLREQAEQRGFDALIHATPLGMFPHVNECFFNGVIPAQIVFDMVYNPAETLLLRNARQQGKAVVPGLDMFIEQAVQQFEIWT